MQRFKVKLPSLTGVSEDVLVVEWLVSTGDRVDAGTELVVVETDKATTGVPSPLAGTLDEIVANEGDDVAVGEALCWIATE